MPEINPVRLAETFIEYVKIDSESGAERRMLEKLAEDLSALGFEVYMDDAGSRVASDGGNLYAAFGGEGEKEPLLLSFHADTVCPGKNVAPIIEDGYIRTDGKTVLGGDDKSGIAAAVEALRVARENALPLRPLEIVITIREETGLEGAKQLDYDRIKSKQAIVLDCSGDVGVIVLQSPTHTVFQATVTGRAAHAGMEPEKGISAIQAAAKAVAGMKLLRIDEETTANVGTFTCVGGTNVVPERVFLSGEARSHNPEKLAAALANIRGCLESAAGESGAKLDYREAPEYYSLNLSPEAPQVVMIARALEKLGITAKYIKAGGGSDANIMMEHGIVPVLVATGMEKVHTTQERISLENLENCARMLLEVLTDID